MVIKPLLPEPRLDCSIPKVLISDTQTISLISDQTERRRGLSGPVSEHMSGYVQQYGDAGLCPQLQHILTQTFFPTAALISMK